MRRVLYRSWFLCSWVLLAGKVPTLATISLVLLSIFTFACTRNKVESPAVCGETQDVVGSAFKVKRLMNPSIISVGDTSMAEWDDSFIVMEITTQNAFTYQWQDIHRRVPIQVGPNDFGIKVYMARDSLHWYIAIEVTDDKVIASSLPYSGDCLGVFFAGSHLDSPIDIHRHINTSANQAAFFQLAIPPSPLLNNIDYFPEYRTDALFRNSDLIHTQFLMSIWTTASGWSAEVRIPLNALDENVNSRLNGHQPLKMNIEYLDYDVKPAERNAQEEWGFNPDNVFCLDRQESNVILPRCMRPVIFD